MQIEYFHMYFGGVTGGLVNYPIFETTIVFWSSLVFGIGIGLFMFFRKRKRQSFGK